MRPHLSYFICCNPRTGGWLLAEGLEGTGIAGRPQEYFIGEYEHVWYKRWGISTYADYVEKVMQVGTTANGVFGAKAHWDEFEELFSRLRQIPGYGELAMPELMSRLFPNLRYLWITRRDRVRQAISYHKAIQTDRWSSIDGWNYPETKDPTFDFKAIDFLLESIMEKEEGWKQYFDESRVKPLVVVYEELEQAYEATIRQVVVDLCISLPANLVITKPRLKKQADLLTEEWVQRYQGLKKAQSEIMRTFSSFQGVHRGETIIVCGCGESLNDFAHPERFITIGVNDVGRSFQPNYLLVVDPKGKIKEDRFQYIETSQAEYLFTQHENLGVPHPNIVRFALRKKQEPDFSDPNSLHYTTLPSPSTYFALCLAVHMGAKRIGLIGMDFTDNHFFGKTGKPLLAPYLTSINEQFRHLSLALQAPGVEVFNLSPKSLITSFPKMPLEEFSALYASSAPSIEGRGPLRIVSYSATPVRGVPAILARCINGGTPHSCRCIWGWNRYASGAVFEGDLNWNESPAEAEAVLREADVVIVHAGKVEPRHRSLLVDKAIVTMAHSHLGVVDQTFVKQGFPGVVVGQAWATLPEFKGWAVVPNPVPLWEQTFQPGMKEQIVTICYTPAVKYDRFPPDDPQYLFSKGYATTMQVLEKLAAQFPLQLEVIHDRQIPHTEVLAMKRRSHIVIDECVTGGYHRNSLEGLATGCVVVNGVGLLPGVTEALRYCTGGEASNPFVFASLDILQGVLTSLIERGTDSLIEEGRANRQWMERYWGFASQWRRLWMPVINQALHHAASLLEKKNAYIRELETAL